MLQYLQQYNPLGNAFLSTLVAALPILTMLYFLALHPTRGSKGSIHKGIEAHKAAALAVLVALLAAIFVFKMPAQTAVMSFAYGALSGLFPIGWIVLAAMLLYNVTVVSGQFEIVKDSVASLSADRRVQAILIAFAFGAFVEGSAGFGTPVAISGALMVGLGFSPLQAAVLCLIANTAPVAFGALGTPITILQSVTGIDPALIAKMAGRQLPFFSAIIPFWVTAVQVKMDGGKWRDVWEMWPMLLVAGGSFGLVQFVSSTYMNYMLVDIVSGIASMVAVALFSKVWQPKKLYGHGNARKPAPGKAGAGKWTAGQVARAWTPWALLTVFVFLWGLPKVKAALNKLPHAVISWKIPYVDGHVFRMPPVVPKQAVDHAVFSLGWASAAGTSIFLAAVLAGLVLGLNGKQWGKAFGQTLSRMKLPLATISLVLGMGYVTKYTGSDAVLGLAFTHTGVLYPFFAAMLGWLGVALTGSDTSSNVMFGSMQQITAQQLGLNPVLVVTANSTGGVMGKMIDAQSIVVSTAACYEDKEEGKLACGPIFRAVLPHSLILAALMGCMVMLQAYVFPGMIPGH